MRQDDYLPLLQAYIAGVQARAGAGGTYQTPDQVAKIVLATLADPAPPVRLRTSAWAEDFTAMKTKADPDGRKLQGDLITRNFGKLPLDPA